MKTRLTIIILFLFSNYYFGQNDLIIEILNDSIKKTSYFAQSNIAYTITNNSEKDYWLIIDAEEFNEDPEYKVEPFFIGLPDFYIYQGNSILNPIFSFGARETNSNQKADTKSKKFRDFCKKFSSDFNNYELEIAYRVSKKIINIKSKTKRYFTTKVNFPIYKGRYFNMKNDDNYFFQISLQNPKELISKYYKVIKNVNKAGLVFTGQIFSNKVPLVYEVYDDPFAN